MHLYFGSLIYTREANGTLRGIVAENDFLGPEWGGRLGTETATPRDVPAGDIAGVYCSSTYIPSGIDVFTGPLRIQRVGSHYSLHWTKPGAVPFFGVGFQIPDDPSRYCFAFYGIVMPPYWVPPASPTQASDDAPAARTAGSTGHLDTALGIGLIQRGDGAWSGAIASTAFLEAPWNGRFGSDRLVRLAGGDGFEGTYQAARMRPDGTTSYNGVLHVRRTGDLYGLHWSSRGEAPLLGVAFEDPAHPGRYAVATWGMRPSAFWNPPPDLHCEGHAD